MITRQQIDEMEAGRELDATIAENIFGYKWMIPELNGKYRLLVDPERAQSLIGTGRRESENKREERYADWSYDRHFPHYSTAWEGAGLVLELLHKQGWEIDIYMTQDNHFLTECLISKPEWQEDDRVRGRDESPFIAICRAALKTKLLTAAREG